MYGGINVRQRLKVRRLLVHAFISKRDRDNHARKVQNVNGGGVSVVPKLVMPNGRRRSDGRDDSVQLPSSLLLELPDFRKVLHLVVPLLQLDGPCSVKVDTQTGLDEILDVRNGRFAGELEGGGNILSPWLVRQVVIRGAVTYSSTIGSVDTVRKVHGERVLVRFPGGDAVASSLQFVLNHLHGSQNRRVRGDLSVYQCAVE